MRSTASLVLLLLAGCAPESPTIDLGRVECAHCRMNVVDARFAAALITKAGRQYSFDGPECMLPHVAEGTIAEAQVKAWYVSDFVRPGRLIEATTAQYALGDSYRSPMRGDVAAFATAAERDSAIASSGGEPLTWDAVRQRLAE
ncbi:MAG TPA: nitrous oxide reductase accessory protein NosL [Flavobacteriales bacterium]|nr:nitrous oxide reductase accessory protein NosL [Flavobacteriales bacterium]HQW85616.1 nitrous oxide reductase accessory protein NosL [Flavobacteriales bacterium]